MRSRWPYALALVAMWVALWGDLSLANLVGGALVTAAVLGIAGRVRPLPMQQFHAPAALRYVWFFARQLVVANIAVARAVLRPSMIRPGVIAVPLQYASDAVVTLVANSITLTPGTLTLETERDNDAAILYVHALDLSDADAVRDGIHELEKRAVDAFGDPEAQAVEARSPADLEQERGEQP